ncbi:MAG: nucleotidyltransferase family protein, partial [Oscillospiraceae bacterium]|nr:nucleotidyltransferase family protein [Oscillospiraceae bacterium]
TDVYISPLSMTYEIHRGLGGEGFSQASRKFTSELLSLAHPIENGSCVMELPPEEHYVYILCHFIKHFIYGGVGVRQLTDLFICQRQWSLDQTKVDRLLEDLELTDFHRKISALWEAWFLDGESDDFTEELGTYILHSGVFGNEPQRATDRMLAEGQNRNYFLARLFPPYRTMKKYFPILQKLPILLPFAWIWRAIRALLFRRKKLVAELHAVSDIDDAALDSRKTFYKKCGLSVYDQ